MKILDSIILFLIGSLTSMVVLHIAGPDTIDINSIEHIENVDEMQVTPAEIYIYTAREKYMFDGKKMLKVADLIENDMSPCCNIVVDKDNDIVNYTISGYGRIRSERFDNDTERDEIINGMQEYCYHNH